MVPGMFKRLGSASIIVVVLVMVVGFLALVATAATPTRDSSSEFDLHSDNASPRGIWSDGTTMWVADWFDDKIYAYELDTGDRQADKDIVLGGSSCPWTSRTSSCSPRGIWSDGNTMWVADDLNLNIFAYDLDTGDRQADKDINSTLGSRRPMV